jgi:hypothetical protein
MEIVQGAFILDQDFSSRAEHDYEQEHEQEQEFISRCRCSSAQ